MERPVRFLPFQCGTRHLRPSHQPLQIQRLQLLPKPPVPSCPSRVPTAAGTRKCLQLNNLRQENSPVTAIFKNLPHVCHNPQHEPQPEACVPHAAARPTTCISPPLSTLPPSCQRPKKPARILSQCFIAVKSFYLCNAFETELPALIYAVPGANAEISDHILRISAEIKMPSSKSLARRLRG